ncbi:MAG TPA: hypothetical protein VMD05_07650 [Candidatus Nanoarchaeia archaeon]|nr:hypothetical protein [Candidatus Nanoarchaeia archaeon]
MPNYKLIVPILLASFLVSSLAVPIFAATYNPGVTVSEYVKYGNFVGSGQSVEAFSDYDWLKLQITNVSGSEITLFSTGQFKNGTSIPGNGTHAVWDISAGTQNGVPSTQGPIIAANLNQGDSIPPNTYYINQTNTAEFLGVSRSVNVLYVLVSTPDYNTSTSYVYDRASGMLLESTSQTITQAQPTPVVSSYAYSIIETNIFGSPIPTPTPTPSPTVPEFSPWIILPLMVAAVVMSIYLLKKKPAAKTLSQK